MKVRIETEVTLDLELMAKTFASMDSGDQAKFLAVAYREMATFTRKDRSGETTELGYIGRETQMHSIGQSFDEQPDARAFVQDLHETTRDDDDVAGSVILDGNPPTPGQAAEIRAWLDASVGPDKAIAAAKAGLPNPTRPDKSWFSSTATPLADMKASIAQIETDAGYRPAGPLEVITTTLRWATLGSTEEPQVVCTCKAGPVLWIDAVVEVNIGPEGCRVGKIVRVNPSDNTVDVLLHPTMQATGDKDVPGEPASGGIVRGPNPVWNNEKSPKDHPSHSVFTNDPVFKGMSPNADIPPKAPNGDICGECAGSGEWTNPAGGRNAVAPCSRGCKKP